MPLRIYLQCRTSAYNENRAEKRDARRFESYREKYLLAYPFSTRLIAGYTHYKGP